MAGSADNGSARTSVFTAGGGDTGAGTGPAAVAGAGDAVAGAGDVVGAAGATTTVGWSFCTSGKVGVSAPELVPGVSDSSGSVAAAAGITQPGGG